MKILVVRLKAIGDSILSLPVCGTLRRAYPNAVIHYLVYEYIEPLLRDHPYIDQTLFISNEERKNSFLYIKKAFEFRRNKYDLVIDIIATPTSALLTFFTGASRKIGFSRPKSRAIFYNKKVQRLVPGANAIDRKLTLLSDLVDNKQFIRNYSIPLPDSEVAPMDFQMQKTGIDTSTHITAFAVTSPQKHKQWPVTYFAQLIDKCIERFNTQAVLFGAPEQVHIVRQIESLTKNKGKIFSNIVTETTRDLATLLKNCNLFVGNDGGARHLADALNIPSFAIFSPLVPKEFWIPELCDKHQAIDIKDVLGINLKQWRNQRSEIKNNLHKYYEKITPELVMDRLSTMY